MAKKKIVVKKPQQESLQLSLLSEVPDVQNKPDTPEQQEFINYSGNSSVVLAATAGSGKTYSCTKRLKELLRRGVDPSRIIFFSFTKAATEELSKRIGNDAIMVTTIHSFCQSIKSIFFKERNSLFLVKPKMIKIIQFKFRKWNITLNFGKFLR